MSGRVCVSIPTDDMKTVKLGHFGDAKYYLHYVFENGEWRLTRKIENPYAGHHDEGEEEELGKRPKIYEMNRDCDIIVATFFGKGGEEYMRRRGLKVVKVKPRTQIHLILEELARTLRVSEPS